MMRTFEMPFSTRLAGGLKNGTLAQVALAFAKKKSAGALPMYTYHPALARAVICDPLHIEGGSGRKRSLFDAIHHKAAEFGAADVGSKLGI
jgi:hypothetical protein